jgi:hypothetical protein
VHDRGVAIAGSLEEVSAHRVEAMMIPKTWIGRERVEEQEPSDRTVNHRRCDGVVQRHHRIVGHA